MKKIFMAFMLLTSLLNAESKEFTGYLESENGSFLIKSLVLMDDYSVTSTIIMNSNEYVFKGIFEYNPEKAILFSLSSEDASNSNISIKIIGNGVLYEATKSGSYTLLSNSGQVKSTFGKWNLVEIPKIETTSVSPNLFLEPETNDTQDNKDIVNAFLPGLSFSFLIPFSGASLYYGPNIHYAFIQGMKTHGDLDDFGGYYDWYMEIGFYKERNSLLNDDIFFIYSTGVNFSFEKFMNSSRGFLIPYFGAKCGGVYFNHLSHGFYIEPNLGVILFQNKNITLNIDTGLFLNTVDLSNFIGTHSSLIFSINL